MYGPFFDGFGLAGSSEGGAEILTAEEEGRAKKDMSPWAMLDQAEDDAGVDADEGEPVLDADQHSQRGDAHTTPAKIYAHTSAASIPHCGPCTAGARFLVSLRNHHLRRHGWPRARRCCLQKCAVQAGLHFLALSAATAPAITAGRAFHSGGGRCGPFQEEEAAQVKHVFLARPVCLWCQPWLTCRCRCRLLAARGHRHGHKCEHTARLPREPPQGDREPHAAPGPCHHH